MKLKGYLMSCSVKNGLTKIENRIREMGVKMYKYYNCMPELKITFKRSYKDYKKSQTVIYFNNAKQDMNYLHFLGFGFEGLFDDIDKMNEIESFGKYRCIINEVDDELDEDIISVDKFIF